jgi:hypothetical protein
VPAEATTSLRTHYSSQEPSPSGSELCLRLFQLLQQNTIGWEAYKQQEFTSYSSRIWEVQDQGASSFGVW